VMTPASWPAAKRVGPTAWDVMVPAETPPLHVGVVTLRRADLARRSAVAHVRVVTAPGPGENDLVPMRPIAARNGFGPVERDQSNGGGDPFDGASLAIAGTTYPHGLGVCAPAAVSFAIGGVAERFTALVGIDDETPDTTATAEVRGDDHLLVRMELRAGQPSMPVDVDVRGVQQISLVVHGTTPTPAHVDWVGPTLHRPLTTGRTPR
ncbi:MAG: NPCBM/NEW2 domain-containing protein, partial [Micrococcales bacterium]|nr:NPCBM/NEW2 domain-containing protein [Micrococcales bacterium]